MATVGTRLMTAEEFYEWSHRPENRDKRCDLVRGEIEEMSLPGRRHGMVCANVARILGNYVVARKNGYVCSNDTGVIVERNPDTVRGPDVMLFEDAATAEQVDEKYGELPPVLAVEVLSPNDTHGKVRRRVQDQLRFGTRLVWVLDPEARNVVVYRPGTGEIVEDRLVEENGELTGDDVLPDFRCRVADFFALPGQQRPAG
jgi:Uma2 family endonuclease